jgi:hypothetical protein
VQDKVKPEEHGHLDLLLNAAEELHRSSSSHGSDDAMDMEPSTAGSPPGLHLAELATETTT